MKNTKIFNIAILLFVIALGAMAQTANFSKMSPLVRQAAISAKNTSKSKPEFGIQQKNKASSICAFIKISGNADEVLSNAGCKKLAQFADIYIADIPLENLFALSRENSVKRIEAGRSNSLCMDTTSSVTNTLPVSSGINLPQAYTGHSVVIGVMDVGFDLTHPNFYDKESRATRISRFWDQLSPDSLGSSLYVGADYRTPEAILAYGRSHDGLIETHGTHTLGIATGTGYTSGFCGMAPDADICLVSNAVNTDIPLIPENQLYKYTTATDVLGFKYIFDYATEVGKPCVISFSEGSIECFDGEQQLMYEVLSQLIGPGRIIVASAGNNGYFNTYLNKPKGRESDGVFLLSGGEQFSLSALSDKDFTFRLAAYGQNREPNAKSISLDIPTATVLSSPDSLLTDTMLAFNEKVVYSIQAYKTALLDNPVAYDVVVSSEDGYCTRLNISLEAVGEDANVQFFSNGTQFHKNNDLNPGLSGGEMKYSVLSPGAAPDVICVGATAYRDSFTGFDGYTHVIDWGHGGEIAGYSSVGPTRFGVCKPDVVAPGTNVRSSMSSFYAETHPYSVPDKYMSCLCSYTDFCNKKYPWGAFTGTSQSTPVVAGAIALWLEANPKLTTTEILDIFSSTCNRVNTNTQGEKDNNSGYGEIDVYAGMLKILGLDGIHEISSSHPNAASIIYKGDGKLEIQLNMDVNKVDDIYLKVFSINGERVMKQKLDFALGKALVSVATLPHGIYAVQLSSKIPQFCGSVLIRR